MPLILFTICIILDIFIDGLKMAMSWAILGYGGCLAIIFFRMGIFVLLMPHAEYESYRFEAIQRRRETKIFLQALKG